MIVDQDSLVSAEIMIGIIKGELEAVLRYLFSVIYILKPGLVSSSVLSRLVQVMAASFIPLGSVDANGE